DPAAVKPEKLFESNEVLAVTIKAPWKKLINDKKNQAPYPATIEFTDSLGQSQSLPLTVGRRGITRQKVCKVPPIKMHFEKDVAKGTMFRGQGALKLVTHCDKGERWQQYYVQEMVIYRLYNLMTDLSFRVRTLSITYADSEKGTAEDPQFGFLIEDDSELAKRNEVLHLKAERIKRSQLEPVQASRMALFEFMISNVDFEQTAGPKPGNCCHNTKLFGLDELANINSVPYDFDSAGLVDTHYAAPNEGLRIDEVTDRLYRGYCVHNSTLEGARQEFLAKEQDIYALIENEPLLNARSKLRMHRFLEAFFEIMHDQADFDKHIIQKCRK
ncbi:MAG: hypothetical protein ACRERV_18465, partial [Methylococcales bacterium]